jgi:hypothetical protein
MFLRHLELVAVRSIEHAVLSLEDGEKQTRKWTLLLGENGVGKSTVLKSIALLTAGSEALPELLGPPETWIRNGREACTMRATLTTAEGEPRQIELALHRGDGIRDVFDRNAGTLDALDRALRHSSRNYLCVGYGVTRRPSPGPRAAMAYWDLFRHPRARSVSTLFSEDALLQPLETWAMDLDYRRRQAGLQVVRETMEDLLPGVQFREIDREHRQLLFDTPDGVVPFSQLSEGYRNMAGWCGDLVYRLTEIYANYHRPLTGRGLLLLDEIDLHLHPVWQRQLRHFLERKLPNFQIIATTNSPLTAQPSGPGELHVLGRKDGGSVTLTAFEGEPRKMSIAELLRSPLFGLDTLDG